MVDLIRDGVPRAELARRGERAVWTALVRTAASAALRGHDCWEWTDLVLHVDSVLGEQARRGRRGHRRSPEQITALLDKVWDKATAWASERPAAWDSEAAKVQARQRARAVMLIVGDPDAPLLDSDRAVLAYAAEQASARGIDRIALPRRAVVEATGLGERSVRNALGRLHHQHLLELVDPGRPSGPSARRSRAALYRIATAEVAASYLYPVNGSVGPPTQVCGTPPVDEVGTPTQVCGTPRLQLVRSAS